MKKVCAEDVCLDVEAVERKGGVCYLCVLRPPPPPCWRLDHNASSASLRGVSFLGKEFIDSMTKRSMSTKTVYSTWLVGVEQRRRGWIGLHATEMYRYVTASFNTTSSSGLLYVHVLAIPIL